MWCWHVCHSCRDVLVVVLWMRNTSSDVLCEGASFDALCDDDVDGVDMLRMHTSTTPFHHHPTHQAHLSQTTIVAALAAKTTTTMGPAMLT